MSRINLQLDADGKSGPVLLMAATMVVFLLSACAGGPPRISVEPRQQDLGLVPQSLVETNYTIRNLGASPLRINKITTSCECTRASLDHDTIPPGESATLRVTLDPVEDNLSGNLARMIYVSSNDPATPQTQVQLLVSIEKPAGDQKQTSLQGAPDTRASPPSPLQTVPPSPSAVPLDPSAYFLPKPVSAMQDHIPPPDVPACVGAQSLANTIDFSWEQHDPSDWREVNTRTSGEYWTYYRCGQTPAAVSAFYRQWLTSTLYGWSEDHAEEYPEGTLLVDKKHMEGTKHGYRWVYLWLLPDKLDALASDLIVVWYDYAPC